MDVNTQNHDMIIEDFSYVSRARIHFRTGDIDNNASDSSKTLKKRGIILILGPKREGT